MESTGIVFNTLNQCFVRHRLRTGGVSARVWSAHACSPSFAPGVSTFLLEGRMSFHTTVGGPDILLNVMFRDTLHFTKSTNVP